MTWLDALLVIAVMSLAALTAERRWTGALIAIGGLLFLRPLLVLAAVSPVLALVAGLVAGLVLAVVGLRFTRSWQTNDVAGMAVGAVAGFMFGTALLLATLTALPIERQAAGLVYPPHDLPGPVARAVQQSPLFAYGRQILLQPLLVAQGDPAVSGSAFTAWLHGYLVHGVPWE